MMEVNNFDTMYFKTKNFTQSDQILFGNDSHKNKYLDKFIKF